MCKLGILINPDEASSTQMKHSSMYSDICMTKDKIDILDQVCVHRINSNALISQP